MAFKDLLNITSILGLLFIVATVAMLFLDMHYSTHEVYTFHLKWTYVAGGIFLGLCLILLPESKVRKLLYNLAHRFTSGKGDKK